jgi:hypothetical protein
MINFITGLFSRGEASLSEASARDASAIASLHIASFRRGWSDQEVEGLLIDRHVIAHRAMIDRKLAGFIMSRIVEDEAEILSSAVGGLRDSCLISTCAGWQVSVRARSFWKSTNTMTRRCAFTTGPALAKYRAELITIPQATAKRPPPLSSGAIFFELIDTCRPPLI